MTDRPQISVIMPVYNAAPYLKQAIESILTQSYRDFEFIIINDGSTDDSDEIIKSFNDDRIIYVSEKQNAGISFRTNQGLAMSRGNYIALMDADDICLPERLEKQLAFIGAHPDVDILGSNATMINENEELVNKMLRPEQHELIHWRIFFGNPMINPSVMFRGSVDRNNLKYYGDTSFPHDYELWTRLIIKVRFHNVQEPLIYYRRYEKSTSSSNKQTHLEFSLKLIQDSIRELTKVSASNGAILALQGNPSRPDADLMEGAAVLGKLYRRFVRRYPMEAAMRNIIRADIASRLYRMGQASQSKSVRVRLFSEALWYNPQRMAKRYLIKVAQRLKFFQ